MTEHTTVELSESESFSFLFTSLWEVESGLRRVVLNIPDTILYKEGVPHRWLFTSEQTGEVMKKKGDKLIPSEIVRSFKNKSRSLRGFKDQNSKLCIATVWYMTSKSTMSSFLVDEVQLDSILGEKSVIEILAVQVFMGGWPVKASGIFEHHFWLRRNSTSGHETFELVSAAEGQAISTFSHKVDRLVIGETHHDSCKSYALRVVKRLESISHSRVANVIVQMVFNSSNVPFVVGARSILLWDPAVVFMDNRLRICFVAGECPEVYADHVSPCLPRRKSQQGGMFDATGHFSSSAPLVSRSTSAPALMTGNALGSTGAEDQHVFPDDDLDGRWGAGSEEEKRAFDAVEGSSEALPAVKFAVRINDANLRSSVDSEEAILPNYAPPIRATLPASNVAYSDEDLPFRSAKLELGRLNGQGRRPLSASATGVYYPGPEGMALKAAVGKSKRSSNLLASLDVGASSGSNGATSNGGGGGLEVVRHKAPRPGERAHCETMTESLKTRLYYYSSQLKEVEKIPIEEFLSKRRPINAPHATRERPKTGIAASMSESKHRNSVPLGGHGVGNGGRRGTSVERKLPNQSGTVCFGDYCALVCVPDIDPALGVGEQAGDQLPSQQQAGMSLGEALSQSQKPAQEQDATKTEGQVDRRAEILPHQLPFRSVLLARAEENYNGCKLWMDSSADLEPGQVEPTPLSGGGGTEGLTELARRHLERVGKQCLGAVRRIVHHTDDQSYDAAWSALNKEYRNQIYAEALSKVHPSRFYYTVPLCDQCWKLYGLLDFYRESIVKGVLDADQAKRGGFRSSSHRKGSPLITRGRGKEGGHFKRHDGDSGLHLFGDRYEQEREQKLLGERQQALLLDHWRQAHELDESLRHEAADEAKEESVQDFINHALEEDGRNIDLGISTAGGALSSWVNFSVESSAAEAGEAGPQSDDRVPPRPATVGIAERPRPSREKHTTATAAATTSAGTKQRSSANPASHLGPRELLGLGVAPNQQRRMQAAPLGNMLSQRAGNHGGDLDVSRGEQAAQATKRPQSSTGSKPTSHSRCARFSPHSLSLLFLFLLNSHFSFSLSLSLLSQIRSANSRPRSAAATTAAVGAGRGAGAGAGAPSAAAKRGIYRGEAEQPNAFRGDAAALFSSLMADESRFSEFISVLRSNPQFISAFAGVASHGHNGGAQGGGAREPQPYPGPGPAALQLNALSLPSLDTRTALHDVTLGGFGVSSGGSEENYQLPDLLEPGAYSFSNMPFSAAPYFPLPSMSAAEDHYDYGSGTLSQAAHPHSDGAHAHQLQAQAQAQAQAQKAQSARERAKSRVPPAPVMRPPIVEEWGGGYLGGLNLNKKIEGFGVTYGQKQEKLILGQRHDGGSSGKKK